MKVEVLYVGEICAGDELQHLLNFGAYGGNVVWCHVCPKLSSLNSAPVPITR